MEKQDQVDRLLTEVGALHSDTDATAITSRVFRLCTYLERRLAAVYRAYGFNRPEADVLSTLLRAGGEPLTPSHLANSLICSTGTMTNRLDRLERAGLLHRSDDPGDRRGTLIELTSSGRKAIEAAIAARKQIEPELVPGLSSEERCTLVALLRQILVTVESSSSDTETTSEPPV